MCFVSACPTAVASMLMHWKMAISDGAFLRLESGGVQHVGRQPGSLLARQTT